ncbi:uncharacterized protein [Coffea arabica]|uniref:Uncharacterized protein isoform X2 n=1 Tax=Coffea arabica TaxID=13443 RepID=A0A6P6V1Q9_COFAR|nr:uncharacterized protein LOC113715708 isoform X2 [Coffea arabica]
MVFLSLQFVNGTIALSTTTSSTTILPSFSPILSKVAAATPSFSAASAVQCCSRVCHQVPSAGRPPAPGLQSFHDVKININNNEKGPPSAREPADGDSEKAAVEGSENGSDGVSGIEVPRPRYISISKARLLNAIVSELFDSQLEADHFLHLSKCLDSILLAEHKCILEEMRLDYDLTNSVESEGNVYQGLSNLERKSESNGKNSYAAGSMEEYGVNGFDNKKSDLSSELASLLASFSDNMKTNPMKRVFCRVAVHARFQRSFVQLLSNAEFEELSVRDLLLTSSLNTDYLLTLPIYVDWRRASESNAIIYRRGHATERQKGLLTVEKLDYLQSMLLQRIFFLISRPLGKFGVWLAEVLKRNKQIRDTILWTENLNDWLKKLPFFQQSYLDDIFSSEDELEVDLLTSSDLPIWLAAQRAVTRYEGILSTTGPRGRLLRKLLTWIGLAPSAPEQALDLKSRTIACDSKPYSGPIFLSRITLGDIWRPASLKHCGNDFWKMLKTAISILISQSTLQEPAFKELILLYTKELDGTDTEDKANVPPLELKIYEKIPIPDLPVIFPHKKLSFRILDAVRLDVATLLGLLAFFINYKFEDILSSPSAILLDVITVSALLIYVFRVVLGYKTTRDRYQLLVNRTLYEKTVASGFGSVHFLLDASQQQQYKEAILAYAILLKGENCQMVSARRVGDECEKFIFDVFNEKIEMPIDKAKSTLLRLGLVTETALEDGTILQAVPCSRVAEILRQKWDGLLA